MEQIKAGNTNFTRNERANDVHNLLSVYDFNKSLKRSYQCQDAIYLLTFQLNGLKNYSGFSVNNFVIAFFMEQKKQLPAAFLMCG